MSAAGAAEEINFDGLVGPTHNYAGLSEGNLASARNSRHGRAPARRGAAGPRQDAAPARAGARARRAAAARAAEHHLAALARLLRQRRRGVGARLEERAASSRAPALASSAMWAANAATISPSADCADGRLHASVANLQTMLHRPLEAEQTERTLRALMPDEARFAVHSRALCRTTRFADEGAANHMRMAPNQGAPGVEIFVYGRRPRAKRAPAFPRARRWRPARPSRAVTGSIQPALCSRARRAGHRRGRLSQRCRRGRARECAFPPRGRVRRQGRALRRGAREGAGCSSRCSSKFRAIACALDDAVTSYLFNSQLVRLPGAGALTLIAPTKCARTTRLRRIVAELIDEPDAADRPGRVRRSARKHAQWRRARLPAPAHRA